jgi:hypothetical protein
MLKLAGFPLSVPGPLRCGHGPRGIVRATIQKEAAFGNLGRFYRY